MPVIIRNSIINKGGRTMANLEKFFIIYPEYADDYKSEYRQLKYTKNDVYWFGVDEKVALQQFRSITRRASEGTKIHLKCINLDELADYTTKQPTDDMIHSMNRNVISHLNHISGQWLSTRSTVNKDGVVTFSIKTRELEKPQRDQYNRNYSPNFSYVHTNSEVSSYYVEEEAYNELIEILFDKYMREVEILTPLKVKINGKEYKKYKPTNEN